MGSGLQSWKIYFMDHKIVFAENLEVMSRCFQKKHQTWFDF